MQHTCPECGREFKGRRERKFCSPACQYAAMRRRKGEETANFKGRDASRATGWDRARRQFPLGQCQRCSARALDRHHRDGDTLNNAEENVERLCRRCHMAVDGRATLPSVSSARKMASRL